MRRPLPLSSPTISISSYEASWLRPSSVRHPFLSESAISGELTWKGFLTISCSGLPGTGSGFWLCGIIAGIRPLGCGVDEMAEQNHYSQQPPRWLAPAIRERSFAPVFAIAFGRRLWLSSVVQRMITKSHRFQLPESANRMISIVIPCLFVTT